MNRINAKSSLADLPQKEPKKQTALGSLLESAGFFILFGLLILGTGFICYMAFRNKFGKLFVILGVFICLSGFVLKIVDIFMKIIGRKV